MPGSRNQRDTRRRYAFDMMPTRNLQRPTHSHISPCVKYMIFLLNFILWLIGCLLVGIGVYAFIEKYNADGWVKIETVYDVILNISLVLIILGSIVFIVGFAGFVGALRENTCLLKFYSLSLLIFFLLGMVIAVIGFVFPHTMQDIIEKYVTVEMIHAYRDDADLHDFINFVQQEFKCCGLSSQGYIQWSMNEYFNCSSPSVEKCGVPFSCCINATDISNNLINIMCGYGVQNQKKISMAEASKKIWTSGCAEVIQIWAERNLYTLGAVALGIALSQLLIINLAKTLEGQIELQKSGVH